MVRGGVAVGILGALAAALCAPFAAPSAAEKADLATLVHVFDQMVLRDQGRVSKWTPGNKQLTIKVMAKFAERESSILESNLAALSEHAKLKIVRDDQAEKPEFLFETTKTLRAHPGVGMRYIGMTQSSWGRLGSEMRSAVIQIIEDWARNDPYAIYRTIPHELMHALGFHGHPLVFDSALSELNTRNSMSEWDLFFVRVLYDPKLPVGTPRVLALPLVCKLIHERLIAEANPDVTDLNRGGPHPYCERLQATQEIVAKTPLDELRLGWAYLRGLGVARDLSEAERWAQKALAGKDQDAQTVLTLIEKAKPAIARQPAAPVARGPVEFKPPAEGTTFSFGDKNFLKIVRVDGVTIHTVTSKDIPYRWAGLFFGRGARIAVSEAETVAAKIWPLEVGKSVEFEHNGTEAGQPVTWKNVIKVLRAETLKIDGKEVATYVVERRVTRVQPTEAEPYEGVYTFWYAPEFGFHAKYRSRFKGTTTERPVSWTVAQVSPPVASR